MTRAVTTDAAAKVRSKVPARPSFQVLDRTFAILDCFTEHQPEWSTTDVARQLHLPIPTVHRILTALASHRYVSQDEASKRFRLGPAALQLGARARQVVDLRSLSLPTLRRLSEDSDETALLTVLTPEGDGTVCLERVETAQPLRLSVTPGRELPLHAGASQKALMAFMDPATRERVLASPLEPLCHNTITDPQDLRADLERIRAMGWASSSEETNVGAWGIAVPVVDDRDLVVCAVGIAGPTPRLVPDRVDDLVTRIHASASEIAEALGHHVPPVAAAPGKAMPRKAGRRTG